MIRCQRIIDNRSGLMQLHRF